MKETYKNIVEYLSDEKKEIDHDLHVLERTEGFADLSDRQKQIIRVTLAVQARANRESVTSTYQNLGMVDRVKRFLNNRNEDSRYCDSRTHITRWYCHGAIASLEEEEFSGDWPKDNPVHFFDAAYHNVNDELEVKKAIEFCGFPCVVHVNDDSNNNKGEETQYHSFLALGHNDSGEIVVWHKEGFDYPYQVTTVSEVFDQYGPRYHWGVRKLRSTNQNKG